MTLVAGRDDLPGLPALVPGLRRRRGRRPRGRPRAARRTCSGSASTRVWLSPFYPSPMADFGYDVSDHCDVDPLFGTLEDFDALAAEAHRLGLRADPRLRPEPHVDRAPVVRGERTPRLPLARPAGRPPNNWAASSAARRGRCDGDGASTTTPTCREQPDLNWRNPDVRAAMLDVLRFWCERGADGFRIDALRQLIKDAGWRDNPANPDWRDGRRPVPRAAPRVHDRPPRGAGRDPRACATRSATTRLLLGELYLPIERLVAYYALRARHAGELPPAHARPGRARDIAALSSATRPRCRRRRVAELGARQPRPPAARHPRSGPAQARVAAMLLLTLRGTPTLYYGDEIGMRDVAIPPEQRAGPVGAARARQGSGATRCARRCSGTRANAGFSDRGEPWLPFPGRERVNVEAQRDDPASLLSLYRRLLRAALAAEPDLRDGAPTGELVSAPRQRVLR